jgi:hypothetical protein
MDFLEKEPRSDPISNAQTAPVILGSTAGPLHSPLKTLLGDAPKPGSQARTKAASLHSHHVISSEAHELQDYKFQLRNSWKLMTRRPADASV